MGFKPYEEFDIITQLTPTEVQAKLEGAVSPRNEAFTNMFSNGPITPFNGYAGDGVFEFEPNIVYRTSFNPEVVGFIVQHETGSKIHIKIKLANFVIFGLYVWVGALSLIGLASLITNKNIFDSTYSYIIPFAIAAFSYWWFISCFNDESNEIKSKLETLLKSA
jgi:hypothetical protein